MRAICSFRPFLSVNICYFKIAFPPYLFIGEVWVRSGLGLKIDLTRLNPFVHQHLKPVGLGVRSNYKNRQMSNKDIRFSHQRYRLSSSYIYALYIKDIGSLPCKKPILTMPKVTRHFVKSHNRNTSTLRPYHFTTTVLNQSRKMPRYWFWESATNRRSKLPSARRGPRQRPS